MAGLGMTMFLDIAFGVCIAALTAYALHVDIAMWQLPIGAFLALLPDFDIALPLLRRAYKGLEEHKTSLMHRPFIVIPLATLIAWWLGGNFWAIVACACVFVHFVHDTKGFGDGGLEWFWPLSKREWSLTGVEDPQPKPPLEEWIYGRWLVPTKLSVLEIVLGSIALGIGIDLTIGPPVGAMLAAIACFGAVVMWVTHHLVKQ